MLKKKLQSSVFNLSHVVSGTADLGFIQPIACYDVVPGDRIRHKLHALVRAQALLAPVMHTVDIDIDAYFVPDRIIWDDAPDFHSGGDDGMNDSVAPTRSYPAEGYGVGSLADMLGLPVVTYDSEGAPVPVTSSNADPHSVLPFRAYNKIFNDFYRDSQLQSEAVISTASGPDTTTNINLLRPCWKRDYYTKARPQPQLGPDVVLPFSGSAPVVSDGTIPQLNVSGVDQNIFVGAATLSGAVRAGTSTSSVTDVEFGSNTGLETDLSESSGISIREQREANALYRALEFNNIWGGRYIEQVWARFQTRVPDYRLDRPEFLGSGSARMQFSEVLQTAEGEDVVGTMRGHGIALTGTNKFRYSVPEHGWIMIVMVIRPKAQYMQGQHRMWNRQSRYDYLMPEFVHVGDQAIANKELYVTAAEPDGVFGFTPIYGEYTTIPSRVFGDFRTTLNYWHMARQFASEPALNSSFVECVPTPRIYAVTPQTANPLMMMIHHKVSARRPLPLTPNYRLM